MVATKITGSLQRLAIGTRQIHFRLPADEYTALKRHLFETGDRTLQDFSVSAVRKKLAAEKRQRKGSPAPAAK